MFALLKSDDACVLNRVFEIFKLRENPWIGLQLTDLFSEVRDLRFEGLDILVRGYLFGGDGIKLLLEISTQFIELLFPFASS